MQNTWKEYLKDLYNLNAEEWVAVNMCDINGSRSGNCFEGEPVRRIGNKLRVEKIKSGKVVFVSEFLKDWV